MSKLERFGIGFCAIAAVAVIVAGHWPMAEAKVGHMIIVSPAENSPVEQDFVLNVAEVGWQVGQIGDTQDGDLLKVGLIPDGGQIGQITLSAGQTTAAVPVHLPDDLTGVFSVLVETTRDGMSGHTAFWGLSVAPFIKYGNSRENALAWDDAAKHRYYSHGGTPAGWDFSEDPHGVKSDLPANIVFGGLPVPFNTGDYIARVYLTSPGADILWMEMDLDGQTAGSLWSATVTMDGREGLPRVISDNWAAWLGSKRREQTLRVDLVKAADGSVVASDTATWTMTVKQPEVGITAGLVSLDLAGGHSYRM